jgi:hypothetical protein
MCRGCFLHQRRVAALLLLLLLLLLVVLLLLLSLVQRQAPAACAGRILQVWTAGPHSKQNCASRVAAVHRASSRDVPVFGHYMAAAAAAR